MNAALTLVDVLLTGAGARGHAGRGHVDVIGGVGHYDYRGTRSNGASRKVKWVCPQWCCVVQ